MKTLKTYEDFCNEEVNWKKAAAGVALGAGLAFGNPTDAISQETDKVELSQTKKSDTIIKSVKPLTESGVKDISNYKTMASIKVPNDFDVKNAEIHSSFLWNSSLPSAPLGGIIFIHTPKLSFFVDIKSNWEFSNEPELIDNWSNEKTILEEEGYSWETSWGAYTKWNKETTESSGSIEHRKIFDIGIGKSLISNNEGTDKYINLRAYIGCGISRTKSERYKMIREYSSEYTNYVYHSDTYSDVNIYDRYEPLKTEYTNKLNITGGLLFDVSMISMGIGFDTTPGGINLMLGFNF